jgi:hypothetical protein
MRYFIVTVDYFSASVEEVFKPLSRYDWRCAIDGITVEYQIVNGTSGKPRSWFERGTIEVEYHAKNMSKTGFVAWQTRSKAPRRLNKKKAQIQAKMEKLL